MKLILMEKKERLVVLTVPDNTVIPPVIKYGYGCIDCVKMHLVKFKYAGIHDDGTIYQLSGIHH